MYVTFLLNFFWDPPPLFFDGEIISAGEKIILAGEKIVLAGQVGKL